jgi:O-antigen/teichoic acid export membrane protein
LSKVIIKNEFNSVKASEDKALPPVVSGFAGRLMVGASAYLLRSLTSGSLMILLNAYVMTRYPLEDVGYLAFLLILSNLIFSIADLGVGHALIQRQRQLTDELASQLFSNLLVFWLLLMFLIGGTYCITNIHLLQMVLVLLLTTPLLVIRQLAVSNMELHFRYASIARIEIAESLGLFITVVILDLVGVGVWGYVIGFVSKSLIGWGLSGRVRSFKVSVTFPTLSPEWRQSLTFGLWFHMGTFLNAIRQLAIPLSLTSMLGFAAAGIVDRAIFVAALVPILLGSIQQRILFPFFSATKDQPERRQAAFERAQTFSASIDKLLYIPILLTLDFLVRQFLSPEYVPMIEFVWVMAVANAAFGSLAAISISALQGLGRPDVVAWIYVINGILPYILVWPFVFWLGPFGAIIANMTSWLTLVMLVRLVKNRLPSVRIGLITIPAFVAFLFALGIGSAVLFLLRECSYGIISSFTATGLAMISYVVILIAIDYQGTKNIWTTIQASIKSQKEK